MPDLTGLGEGALLNYLAGSSDLGNDAALSRIVGASDPPPVGAYSTHLSRPAYPQSVWFDGTDRANIWPTYNAFQMTISEFSFRIATASASGVLRWGLWLLNGTNGAPSSLLADLGTVSSTTAGVKTITGLSVVLPAGRIGFGYASQGGAAGGALYSGATVSGIVSSAADPMNNGYTIDAAGAFPTTFTPAALSLYAPPAVSIRRSA